MNATADIPVIECQTRAMRFSAAVRFETMGETGIVHNAWFTTPHSWQYEAWVKGRESVAPFETEADARAYVRRTLERGKR